MDGFDLLECESHRSICKSECEEAKSNFLQLLSKYIIGPLSLCNEIVEIVFGQFNQFFI